MNAKRRYQQVFFLLFAPVALHIAYLNLYFERRGLSHTEIGTLAAVMSGVGVLAPLIFGIWADRLGHRRRVLLWLALGAAVFYPLHWLGGSLAILIPVTIAVGICRSPLVPLVDALCLDALHAAGDRQGETYASVRLWGSLGFIAAGTLLPLLLDNSPDSDPLLRLRPVFLAFFACFALMALRLQFMADPPQEEEHGLDEPAGSLRAVLAVPKLKRLIVLLLISWAANSVYYTFLPLYLDDIGVADQWKGAYFSVGVLAETILMAFGVPLMRRFGVRRMMLAGLVGRALRLLALSWRLPPLVVLLAVQPLHSLGFAALHLATIAFLARAVPERQRATGQVLVVSLVIGVGGILGNLLGGTTSDWASAGGFAWTGRTGLYAAFYVAGLLQTGITAIAWLTLREPEGRATSRRT